MEFIRFAMMLLLVISSMESRTLTRSLAEENLKSIISEALEALKELEYEENVEDDVIETDNNNNQIKDEMAREFMAQRNERELEKEIADIIQDMKASKMVEDLENKRDAGEEEKSVQYATSNDEVIGDKKTASSREETAKVLLEDNLDDLVDFIARGMKDDGNSVKIERMKKDKIQTKEEKTTLKNVEMKEVEDKKSCGREGDCGREKKELKETVDAIIGEERKKELKTHNDDDDKENSKKNVIDERTTKENVEKESSMKKNIEKEIAVKNEDKVATARNDDIRSLIHNILSGKNEQKRDALANVVEGILKRF